MLATASWAGERPMAEATVNPAKPNPVAVHMTSRIISSHAFSEQGPKLTSGAIVEYMVTAAIPDGSVTFNSFTEAVPPFMALYIGDMGDGSGPIMWEANDPGIRISYENLESVNDNIEFSSDGGQSYDYVPAPEQEGFNRKITKFRVKPTFTPEFGGGAETVIKYRMRVR